jgi:uncharacterized protein (DUF1778 family)
MTTETKRRKPCTSYKLPKPTRSKIIEISVTPVELALLREVALVKDDALALVVRDAALKAARKYLRDHETLFSTDAKNAAYVKDLKRYHATKNAATVNTGTDEEGSSDAS